MPKVLRSLPTVSELLDNPSLRPLVDRVSRSVVVSRARRFLEDLQTQMRTTAANVQFPTPAELAQRIAEWIAVEEQPVMTPVINATGTLVHPELGRVPLAEDAIAAIAATSQGYADVEMDLERGDRIDRGTAVEDLLTRLTGTEAAVVVNNNAAATLLAFAALAKGREVVVSRGHFIDDDGYRLPDAVVASGALLREVGTTNRTRISDYANAIGAQTAALLLVHTATVAAEAGEEASLADLVTLGQKNSLPVIEDLGSGALMDLTKFGVQGEPVVADRARAGADLILFSGDKLLGGPQCGLIVGRKSLVQKIAQHPLRRALRPSKLTLAALGATLRLYQDPDLAERLVPLLSLLATPLDNLRLRAERLAPQLAVGGVVNVEAVPAQACLGAGTLSHHKLPTVCLALTPKAGTAESLAATLRKGAPPVVGRIQAGRLLLDLRSVPPRDDAQLVAAIEALKPRLPEAAAGDLEAIPL